MDRMISLARIMFAGLGIYLSIAIVSNAMVTFHFMFQGFSWEVAGTSAIWLMVSLAMLAAVVLLFIVNGDKWAHKLIARGVAGDKPLSIDLTLTMAFRLVCVGAGLLCLRFLVYSLSHLVIYIILFMQSPNTQIFRKGIKVDHIQPLLYVFLAAYLLCGAPHFVRWQVKKTLEFCGKK